MKIKATCFLALLFGVSLVSAQTITRCGGPTNALSINWPNFHFDACHTGNNPYEHLLSPSTVSNLVVDWKYELSENPVTASPIVANGVVYAVGQGDLVALNAKTGDSIWAPPFNVRDDVAVANGVLYASSPNNILYALDAGTGELNWLYQMPAAPGAPVIADGIVYVTVDTTVYALNAVNGSFTWQQMTGPTKGVPLVVNGVFYTADTAGNVYALNARTGTLLWKTTAGSSVTSSLTVVNSVVYIGSSDNQEPAVYALNALTGGLIWKHPLADSLTFTDPSPAVANGIVYVSSDQNLSALDASTGTLRWQHSAPYAYGQSAPAVANGVVYLGSCNANYFRPVYGLDAATGTVLWEYDTDSPFTIRSSPAIANGMLFIGSSDGSLFAFHLPNQ